MRDPKYSELIAKQFLGHTNAKENKIISNWLDRSDEHKKLYREYELIWSKTQINHVATNAEKVYDKISLAINDDKQKYLSHELIPKKFNWSPFVIKAAAAVILFVLVASLTIKYVFTETETVDNNIVSRINKTLPKGQKLKVFLPDGSTAWLNAESSLTFPERFDGSSRIVELDGEAFFSVKKDTLKPFIVRTDQLDVTVLGTTFNVRTYQKESSADVALESGKVLVSMQVKDKEQVFLLPGEGIRIDKTSGEFHKTTIDPLDAYGWKDGVLYFKDATFEQIISKLSRWYGVEIEVQNFDNSEWAYSSEFQNEYLSNVLESMSFSKEFEYKLDQNKVFIKF
ncbi:MAG: DUF4974 domain-containing protein [Cyclobacteriaceae bacterium]|nr:DUF4974 domain-containing protein [Cyclobacteriaceae bacterium]